MKANLRTILSIVVAVLMTGALGCRSATETTNAGGEGSSSSWFATGPRVPAGTTLTVRLLRTLSSESASSGDPWQGVLTSNIVVGDRLAMPAGSPVSGTVAEVRPARRGDRAMLHLRVRSVTVNGKSTPLDADAGPVIAGSPRARNLGAIAGGAAAGALLGKLLGGDGGDAARGAVVGGGVATGVVAASKGYQVVLREGTVIGFTMSETVAVR